VKHRVDLRVRRQSKFISQFADPALDLKRAIISQRKFLRNPVLDDLLMIWPQTEKNLTSFRKGTYTSFFVSLIFILCLVRFRLF